MNPFPHYRSQFSATSATSATPTPISPSKFLFIPIIHYFSTKNHQNSIFLNYFLISICKTLNVHRTFAPRNKKRDNFTSPPMSRPLDGLWTVSVKSPDSLASKFSQIFFVNYAGYYPAKVHRPHGLISPICLISPIGLIV